MKITRRLPGAGQQQTMFVLSDYYADGVSGYLSAEDLNELALLGAQFRKVKGLPRDHPARKESVDNLRRWLDKHSDEKF